ncbi:alcohol dehydrogenase catalytic domain-containing protein [Actinomadura luzonensis]|uniref:alcohol dehydrogenase catalytic domain-containing protein n=1 Tax=Actinomadura luzonensis TaxID=2805427 RepID=UPI0027E2F98E|nr:alcohol dehydrogenase catalytic domain-containing protein [Actinomadura luzonensis]
MRAVVLRRYGGPEELAVEEVPDPVTGPGQVLVEVAVAGVTFVETQVRADRGPRRAELPAVLGNGVAGTVVAVGEGADPALAGARVVTTLGGQGGYAELAVADAADVIPVPAGVPAEHAVALLADGRTALGLTRAPRPRRESGCWSRRPGAAWAACWCSSPAPPGASWARPAAPPSVRWPPPWARS